MLIVTWILQFVIKIYGKDITLIEAQAIKVMADAIDLACSERMDRNLAQILKS